MSEPKHWCLELCFFALGSLVRWECTQVWEGGEGLVLVVGPYLGACPRKQASMWGHIHQTSGVGREREGKRNLLLLSPAPLEFALTLMWHPQASAKSETEFREMAIGAARSQLWGDGQESDRTKLEPWIPNCVNGVSHFTSLSLNFLTCRMGNTLHLIELS